MSSTREPGIIFERCHHVRAIIRHEDVVLALDAKFLLGKKKKEEKQDKYKSSVNSSESRRDTD